MNQYENAVHEFVHGNGFAPEMVPPFVPFRVLATQVRMEWRNREGGGAPSQPTPIFTHLIEPI